MPENDSQYSFAQKTKEKFDFYLLSLVFTLLALSIQTATFPGPRVANAFELVGWATLLLSGFAGLVRMKYDPLQRIRRTQKDDIESQMAFTKNRPAMARHFPSPEQQETDLKAIYSVLRKLSVVETISQGIHQYGFVAGVVFIVVSRSWVHVGAIATQVCKG